MVKLVLSLIVSFFCLIPLWLYLLARWAFNPEGFFAEIILFGVGIWALGAAQFFLFLLWVLLMVRVWTAKS